MHNYNDYFNRQIQLWGEATQKELQDKKITIIGCGGLGSSLALALGSSGIGHIDLVDFDDVSLSNIHRQIAFTQTDVGKNKAQTVSDIIHARSPYVTTNVFNMDFETYAKEKHKCNLLIDATDNLPVREQIDAYAKKTQTPWIYGSVEEFNGQVCFFDKSTFGAFVISEHKPGGIAAPIVMHIASLQANLALRYLANLSVKKDKLYYLYIDKEGELITQKFDMPIEENT